jgi:large subunit ribosomal protein L5
MSLKQNYREKIQPKLLKDLNLSNVHEVPKVVKVTVNRGLGEAAQNAKALEASIEELATITGQKVMVTRARACRSVWPSPCVATACMRSSSV